MTGLFPRDGGELDFKGQVLTAYVRKRSNTQRSHAQMVFQDPYASLNPRHTVDNTIAAGLMTWGVSAEEAWDLHS